jgi:hypothetical protein
MYNSLIKAGNGWAAKFTQGNPVGYIESDSVKSLVNNYDLNDSEYEEIRPADL